MPLDRLQISQPQPATAQLQGLEFLDRQKRTGLLERQVGLQEQNFQFKQMQNQLAQGMQFIPFLKKEDYPKFRNWVSKIGGPSELLPEEAPEDFEGFKNKIFLGADNLTKMNLEQFKAWQKQVEEQLKQENREKLETQKQFGAETIQKLRETGQLGLEAEKQKNRIELEKLKASLKSEKDKGKTDFFQEETKLRDKFSQLSNVYVSVRDAHNRVKAAAKDPSAAGDLALIFNYMKVLDPGSTVREGEFATAQNSGSIPQRIWARYNNVLKGERLEASQRVDFVDRSERLYREQEKSHRQLRGEYRRIAENYDLNPENIIVNYLPSGTNKKPEATITETGQITSDPSKMSDEELLRELSK